MTSKPKKKKHYLTLAQKNEVKRLEGKKPRGEVAEQFNVAPGTIGRIWASHVIAEPAPAPKPADPGDLAQSLLDINAAIDMANDMARPLGLKVVLVKA